MPQCKMSNCREEARPTGKRYCEAHYAAYKDKQAKYAAIRATLRSCPRCDQKLTKTRHDNGHLFCGECQEEADRQAEMYRTATAAHNATVGRLASLETCSDVASLKQWIKENLFK